MPSRPSQGEVHSQEKPAGHGRSGPHSGAGAGRQVPGQGGHTPSVVQGMAGQGPSGTHTAPGPQSALVRQRGSVTGTHCVVQVSTQPSGGGGGGTGSGGSVGSGGVAGSSPGAPGSLRVPGSAVPEPEPPLPVGRPQVAVHTVSQREPGGQGRSGPQAGGGGGGQSAGAQMRKPPPPQSHIASGGQ
jgi:hypothetical protein